MVEQFIARRSASDGGPAWICSPSVNPCEGFAAPGAVPRFAMSHRLIRPGVFFLRAPWRLRVGRRAKIAWRRVCAACAFVLLGVGEAYRGGGSEARDSVPPSPPPQSRGLVGERLLWSAVLEDAFAVRGGAPATDYERTDTHAWIDDVTTDAPGSLAFICGVFGFDVHATRAALQEITGPSGDLESVRVPRRSFRLAPAAP